MGWEDSVWELQRQRCPLSITVLPASFICLVVLLHHTLFSSGVNVDHAFLVWLSSCVPSGAGWWGGNQSKTLLLLAFFLVPALGLDVLFAPGLLGTEKEWQ